MKNFNYKKKMEKQTDLGNHISYFTDPENADLVTEKSIQDGHEEQGVPCPRIKSCTILKISNSAKQLEKTVNPCATGLWNKEGNFDREKFAQLSSMALTSVNGTKYVTKKIYEQLCNFDAKYGPDNCPAPRFGLNCPFLGFTVSWERITKGSSSELFDYYYDLIILGEKVLSLEQIEKFYTGQLFKERSKRFEQ